MNDLMKKAAADRMAKVNPKLVPVVEKVVESGKKVMYAEQTRGMFLEAMKAGTDPESIGAAVAKLMGILQNQAKGTIPAEVLIPAATLLLFEGLAFLEDAGMATVDANFLAECTQAMGSAMLQMMGVSPEKLQGMMQQGAPQGQPAQPAGIVQGVA